MDNDNKYTVEQFAKAIKEKYPVYKDIDDNKLVEAILKKYPQYEQGLKKKEQIEQPSQVSPFGHGGMARSGLGVQEEVSEPISQASLEGLEGEQSQSQSASKLPINPFQKMDFPKVGEYQTARDEFIQKLPELEQESIQPQSSTRVQNDIVMPELEPEINTIKDYLNYKGIRGSVIGFSDNDNIERKLRDGEREILDERLKEAIKYEKGIGSGVPNSYLMTFAKNVQSGIAGLMRTVDDYSVPGAIKKAKNKKYDEDVQAGLKSVREIWDHIHEGDEKTTLGKAADMVENIGGDWDAPDDAFGSFAGGVGHILPDLMALPIMPEMKIAQLAKYGINHIPKFPVLLGMKESVHGETIPEKAMGFGKGYMEGLKYEALGLTGRQVGDLFKGLKAAPILTPTTSSIASGVLFGADAAITEYQETGQITSQNVLSAAGMGVAFGAKDMLSGSIDVMNRSMNKKAYTAFLTSSDKAVEAISQMDIDPKKLRKQSIDLGEKIATEKDAEVKNEMVLAKNVIDNTILINAMAKEVTKNPEQFIKAIDESGWLSDKEKANWKNKINNTVNNTDKGLLKTRAIQDDINILKEKRDYIESQKETLGEETVKAKVEPIIKSIKELEVELGEKINKPEELKPIVREEVKKEFKEQVQKERLEYDEKIKEVQERLKLEKEPDLNISESVEETLDKISNNEPVVNERLKEASDLLYNEYKKLEAMKDATKREYTTEQIESMQKILGEEITNLNNRINEQAERGEFSTEKVKLANEVEVSQITERGEGKDIKPKESEKVEEVKTEPKEEIKEAEPITEKKEEIEGSELKTIKAGESDYTVIDGKVNLVKKDGTLQEFSDKAMESKGSKEIVEKWNKEYGKETIEPITQEKEIEGQNKIEKDKELDKEKIEKPVIQGKEGEVKGSKKIEKPIIKGKELSPNKKVSVSKTTAIKEVSKNRGMKEMEAGFLYNKYGKGEPVDAFEEGLSKTMQDKLEKNGFIEYDITGIYGDYIITEKGKDFVKAVEGRIKTRQGLKEGNDLFPENANVPEVKQEPITEKKEEVKGSKEKKELTTEERIDDLQERVNNENNPVELEKLRGELNKLKKERNKGDLLSDVESSGKKYEAEPSPIDNVDFQEVPKLRNILTDLANGLKKKIRYSVMKRNVAGYYSPSSSLIAIKKANNIEVISHEVGHYLDDVYKLLDNVDNNLNKELSKFWAGGSRPPRGVSKAEKLKYKQQEGFAEWLRVFVLNPEAAKESALIYDLYNSKVDKSTKDVIGNFSNQMRGLLSATKISSVSSIIHSSNPEKRSLARKIFPKFLIEPFKSKASFLTRVDNQYFHGEDGFRKAMKVKGVESVLPHKDFEILSRLTLGHDDVFFNVMEKGMVNGEMKRKIDEKTGMPKTRTWLFEPAKGKEFEKDIAINTNRMIADRTIEFVDRLTKRKILEDIEQGKLPPEEVLKNFPELLKKETKILRTDVDGNMTVRELIEEMKFNDIKPEDKKLYDFTHLDVSGISLGVKGKKRNDYLVAKDIIKEYDQIIKNNPDKKEIYDELKRRYQDFANDNLLFAVEKGRISKEQYDLIKELNAEYIAFARIKQTEIGGDIFENAFFSDGTSSIGNVKEVIHRLKGSSRDMVDPYVALINSTYEIMKDAKRNEAMVAFRDMLTIQRGMREGDVMDLAEIGFRVKSKDSYTIPIYVKGEKEYWRFSPDIYESLIGIHDISHDLPLIFTAYAKILRPSVTKFPTFQVRNRIRDFQNRLVISSLFPKFSNFRNKTKGYNDYELFGGGQFGYHLRNKGSYYDMIQKTMKEAKTENTIFVKPSDLAKMYDKLLGNSEKKTRIEEFYNVYDHYKKKGYSDYDAKLKAAFEARDLLDFKVIGGYVVALNDMLPFTNAKIRGFSKLVKTMHKHPGQFTAKFLIYAMLPQIANTLLIRNQDDDIIEEYKNLPNYRRDLFYNIPIHKLGMKRIHWLTIPKPFEVGLMASLIGRFVDAAVLDDKLEDQFDSDYVKFITKGLSPIDMTGITTNSGSVKSLTSNYDAFRGQNIIPEYEKDIDVRLRKTEQSSRLGKLGQKLSKDSFDPRQVDYFIKGTFSYFGDFGIRLSNIGSETAKDKIGWELTGLAKESYDSPYGNKDVKWVVDNAKKYKLGKDDDYKELNALLVAYRNETDEGKKEEIKKAIDDYADKLKKLWKDKDLMEYHNKLYYDKPETKSSSIYIP